MCLAIPGIITHVDGKSARVNFGGIERAVALDILPDAKVGEYILTHAGFALQRIDEKEATELIELFRELEAAAKEMENEPPQ